MKLYTLESACKVQLMARACDEPYEFVPDDVAESHAQDLKDAASYKLAFRALVRRMLEKIRLLFYNLLLLFKRRI